jgi:hypothetical protein
MKETLINGKRAVIAHHQSSEVAEPSEGPFYDPPSLVAAQRPAVLRRRFAPVLAVQGDQFDAPRRQSPAQRIAIVTAVGNQTARLLPASYPDRLERRLDEFDLRGGSRVKVVSQRNTRAVDHHHPLCPLAPLGFSHSVAPFFAGAKLPSRNDSLHFNCCCSFNSARNARQIVSQTPCSSQSLSRRQQVDGEGNSSGKSCHRAPLRRIHKMPSSTLRSGAAGRPPRGRGGRFGSKGRIFSHWASVSNRPYRAIGPPSGADSCCDPPPQENNYSKFIPLSRVLKWLLGNIGQIRTSDRLSAVYLLPPPPRTASGRRWLKCLSARP